MGFLVEGDYLLLTTCRWQANLTIYGRGTMGIMYRTISRW